jgi:hypothetical protein
MRAKIIQRSCSAGRIAEEDVTPICDQDLNRSFAQICTSQDGVKITENVRIHFACLRSTD